MMNTHSWPDPFFAELGVAFGFRYRPNELLSFHTTSRMGGPADVWLPVNSANELAQAVLLANRYQVPVFILGSGSNLLVSDAGIRGLVIANRATQVYFPADESHPAVITVESGVNLASLARRCAQRGLSGLEWAVGVPGTIGGAIAGNAGAFGGQIADSLVQAELLSPSGERMWQEVGWFEYGYRSSRIKQQSQPWVVLQAEFKLTSAPSELIVAQLNAFNERRKSSQPPGATMGSMFKNPPGYYAGRLIDQAGLKGYQVGQAQISAIHANFFQNLGGATTADMLELIRTAQDAVAQKFGINLELEIEVVGEINS